MRILIGLLISAGFLYFSLRGQDFNAVRDAFRQVTLWYLVPAVVLYFLGLCVRAVRWRLLLVPVADVPVRSLLSINAVGLMANNVLPLRTGEVVRAYALSKRAPVTKSAALGTIAVERIFDGITMLLFISVSMVFVSLTSDLRHVAVLAAVLFSIALALVMLLAHGGSVRDRFLQVALGFLPGSVSERAGRMADSFIAGLGVFTNWRSLLLVGGTSILAWSFEASVYWVTARAFGGEIADVMGVAETVLTTGIANLATLVPSSPGYVGPFEAAVILVLNGALGLTREMALSYGILVHALLYFPVTIWGAIEWSRLHLSLRQVEAHDGPEQTVATAGARQ
ncbi:MAG: flippase-like domain-containing protein [Thermomicrobiales bacterium]|nr:flippase-like domain-containing protein [Thermomicrobiales bacterium]